MPHAGHGSLERNPIASLDLMASSGNSEKAYCLFPYGYSNYSRRGYAENLLQFGDLPSLEAGGPPMVTTLGGAGLAISSHSAHAAEAAGYVRYVALPQIQATLYAQAGGQPGHRRAAFGWTRTTPGSRIRLLPLLRCRRWTGRTCVPVTPATSMDSKTPPVPSSTAISPAS